MKSGLNNYCLILSKADIEKTGGSSLYGTVAIILAGLFHAELTPRKVPLAMKESLSPLLHEQCLMSVIVSVVSSLLRLDALGFNWQKI